jgi:hypothetical protein
MDKEVNTMKKMSSFTDIGQFRNIIKSIVNHACYEGQDENDEPIYNPVAEKPKVTFTGTVKLHGSNLGVAYNDVDGLWVQSRSNIITPEKDNAGSAQFVMHFARTWESMIKEIALREEIDLSQNTVLLYAEWCGGNIQKGVAISGLDKMAVIFDAKVMPFDTEDESYYVNSSGLSENSFNIYNIEQFGIFKIEVDFARPDIAQNEMVKLVEEVEDECPAGKFFGRKKDEDNTTGEGIVWRAEYKGRRYIYKTKGQKHSTSKVKKVVEIDTAKLDSILEFIEYAVTENRLNQAIEQVFTSESRDIDVKATGDFIRWVVNDIHKEETDVLYENKLEAKEVNKYISDKSRKWFMNYINTGVGL